MVGQAGLTTVLAQIGFLLINCSYGVAFRKQQCFVKPWGLFYCFILNFNHGVTLSLPFCVSSRYQVVVQHVGYHFDTISYCYDSIRWPDKIVLLRGNHESRQITQIYGFYGMLFCLSDCCSIIIVLV